MTIQSDLPVNVIWFLRHHVDHVVKLDFLLALHRAPGGVVAVPVVANRLEISRGQVRDMAGELEADQLVRIAGDQVELSPRSIEDRLAIADLATCCLRDRGSVLQVLHVLGRH